MLHIEWPSVPCVQPRVPGLVSLKRCASLESASTAMFSLDSPFTKAYHKEMMHACIKDAFVQSMKYNFPCPTWGASRGFEPRL